jgi:hypothetical protein
MFSRPSLLLLLTALMFIGGGCSLYLDDYRYVPRPAIAGIPPKPAEGTSPQLTVLASIVGVRRDDAKSGIPSSVEVQLQFENAGPQKITFDPHTLQMSDASLTNLLPPIVRPESSAVLAPSETAAYTAYFPFPPGRSPDDMDLQALKLRWTLKLDDRPVSQVVMFRLAYPSYYYYGYYPGPYYYWYPPPVWYGSSVVVVHGHRW